MSLLIRFLRGRAGDPAWERPALFGLLALTSLLYFWDLEVSGWGNAFYSAAAQSGAANWEAFLFGSSDPANSITVDKPPASLWPMALAVRMFGLHPLSVMAPQAIFGVATVALTYLTVRRHFSASTALLAGGILALTPVAVLMFRYNNPDALLVLLMTAATYLTLRGIETGRLRWLLLAGLCIGLAFLAKQMEAFLILPVLAGVYLWTAPGRVSKRLLHLLAALGAVVVSAGWWVAIVELTPAAGRPYIGGSQNNDFLELTFGYNGFGRLTGNEPGSVRNAPVPSETEPGFSHLVRLLGSQFNGQISWLLPAAVIVMVVALVLLRATLRVSPQRATLSLFAGTLVITAVVVSLMSGIVHPYYTLALAPSLAAVLAIGAGMLWSRRAHRWARIISAATVLLTAFWTYVMLLQVPDWLPWLKEVILVLAVVAPLLLVLPQPGKGLSVAARAATLATLLLAPTAFSLQTIGEAHNGAIVAAGPLIRQPAAEGVNPASLDALLQGTPVTPGMGALLAKPPGHYRWVAAVVGSNNAALFQLASRHPVMAVGGFNGTDPSPTLSEFKSLVAQGTIHYFIQSVPLGSPSEDLASASEISTWVTTHYPQKIVGETAVYDLAR